MEFLNLSYVILFTLTISMVASFIKKNKNIVIALSNITLIVVNFIILISPKLHNKPYNFGKVLNYDISFIFDPISIIFCLMVSSLYLMTNLYSFAFIKVQNTSFLNKDLNPKIHFFFMPIAILATISIAYSANLLTLFIFYEILTLSTYPLVIQSFTDHAKNSGKFYIISLFTSSSFFLLFALIYMDYNYGSLDFSQNVFNTKDVIILLICFIFGFSKTAIFPIYKWLPKAMVAPIPVSALLHAVAVVKSGIFALIKVFVYLFGLDYLSNMHQTIPWSIDWITYLACFTMLFAGIKACLQENLKKILAYSSISQLSYMIILLSFTSLSSFKASYLLMISHSISKITLFFSSGIIYITLHKSEINELQGISRILPIPVALFILSSFSIIGLPPSNGWIIKSMIFDSISSDNFIGSFVKTSFIFSTIMSCYYLLKPAYMMLSPLNEPLEIYHQKTTLLSLIIFITFSLSIIFYIYIDKILMI